MNIKKIIAREGLALLSIVLLASAVDFLRGMIKYTPITIIGAYFVYLALRFVGWAIRTLKEK